MYISPDPCQVYAYSRHIRSNLERYLDVAAASLSPIVVLDDGGKAVEVIVPVTVDQINIIRLDKEGNGTDLLGTQIYDGPDAD